MESIINNDLHPYSSDEFDNEFDNDENCFIFLSAI